MASLAFEPPLDAFCFPKRTVIKAGASRYLTTKMMKSHEVRQDKVTCGEATHHVWMTQPALNKGESQQHFMYTETCVL